jgi:hypothetical protein
LLGFGPLRFVRQAEMEVMAQFIAVQELRTPNARQSAVAATELALKISFFNP